MRKAEPQGGERTGAGLGQCQERAIDGRRGGERMELIGKQRLEAAVQVDFDTIDVNLKKVILFGDVIIHADNVP